MLLFKRKGTDKMDCPFCGHQMEKGEISITGGRGTIYWAPANYMEKHAFKISQMTHTIKKGGGIIISRQTSNISEPLYAYRCPVCKKIIINY